MALSSRLKLWEQKIKEEKKSPVTAAQPPPPPPPPLSAVPGGFLKQLVRETEKETHHKEPELKEEKTPRKLSDNLVQNFLLPDQTPPILEAEMALRAEQLVNGERGRHTALTEKKTSSPRRIMSPDPKNHKTGSESSTPEVSWQEQMPSPRTDTAKSPAPPMEKEVKKEEVKVQQEVKPLKQEVKEPRQEPEGQMTVTPIREEHKVPVRDVWYEAGKVWYAHKDGYTLATQLKPDEGTPELPDGRVRVRLDSDGSVHDVSQYEIEKLNPPELDLCEDLSDLVSVNESSVLHTLTSRAKGHLPLTHAGPNLLALWPPLSPPGKGLRSRRWETWEAPGPLQALVRRVYVSMVGQRKDQTLVALGRSGTGKTTSCQSFSQELLKQAGTAGGSVTLERLQAVFTVLRSFGCVGSSHSEASSRFAMVLSLDFNHAGLAAAAHLQTMLLEKWRVCQRPKGESNFLVFSQMLSGLSTDMRTELQLHQLKEHNSFGISCPTKVDEKQRASVGFGKLLAAMNTLGFSVDEQKAIWHVLAGIYHLGVAGTCKVGRKQFMSFDSAQTASAILGCEGEELHTAVFKHHLRQLLQRATGGVRERRAAEEPEDGPKLSAAQCVEGMAAGLYEELFTTIVSLINRALHSQQLTLASVIVVDTPGLRNPRHSRDDRAAGFSELCHNYLQERLLEHYFNHTFTDTLERHTRFRYDLSGWFGQVQNNPSVLNASSLLQNSSIGAVKALFSPRASMPPLCRGLGGVEGGSQRSLERCGTLRKTLSGGMAALRRHSQCIAVKLQADALLNLIRRARPVFLQCLSAKTDGCGFDVPALRVQLHSTHLLPALQLYRTGYPEHMSLGDFRCRFQALSAPIMKRYGSVFITPDERKAVEELLIDLDLDKKSIVLGASRVFMKRDVLRSLDQQRDQLLSSWLVQLQASCLGHMGRQKYRRMKVQQMAVSCIQRNVRVLTAVAHWSWWKLLCRVRPLLDVNMDDQRLRSKEDEITTLRRRLEKSEKERNELRQTADNLETKDEITTLRRRLEKSEKERNELRQTADNLETKVYLSDERFRGEAMSQALDTERTERLRLAKENKELQSRVDQSKVTLEALERQLEEEKQKVKNKEALSGVATESELQLQLECAQTEVEFLRRRLRQTEERLESEKEARQLLDTKVQELQSQLDQSKRSVTELKRHCRRLTSDLQDARVLTDSLQSRTHELERKQRRFDSELTQALEQADNEREQKERAIQENTTLGAEIFTLHKTLKESQVEVTHLQQQKEELCAQICDLSVPLHLTSDSIPELKKKLRELEIRDKERSEEISQMTARIKQQEQMHLRFEMEMERMKQIHQKELEDKDEELEDVQKSSQRRLRQLEMQLEQEYEEKQMVVHEKHDLEGLIATLCEQVGHRDFDVEKRLKRDLKRTHALLNDAQLLLSTVEQPGQGHDPGAKEQLERLCCQLEDSDARRLESESAQKTLAAELENTQIELESICKQKSLVDEQLAQLRYERTDLMKRLEEDQEDLNELMKKHKALIAQLQTSVARVQFLESSTVARSIVSKQEARICDLENKLEFQRGQVKRFEVLVLRLRDSVVRLGEELEQAAQAEARERENSRYYQLRLADMKLEMNDLSVREQESSRRRMELEMQVEELSAVRQTLQADLETSIRRIVDLQAALEEVESSDESDTESVQTAVESFSRRKDLDTMSSVGSSVGTEDVGEGIRQWAGVPRGGRGGRTSPYAGSSSGRQSVTDTMSTYSFRSCTQDLDEDVKESSGGLGRASSSTALSELLEGLRKKRAGWERGSEVGEGSAVSLPIYQTTGASTLRRRSSALSLEAEEGLEDLPRPSILKPPSPHLPRASSLRSLSEAGPTSSTTTTTTGKMNRFSSCDSLASVTSTASSRRHLSNLSIPEEGEEEPRSKAMPPLGSYQPIRRRLLGGLVAETGESQLGSEPLVFQNRRLLGNQDKERAGVDAGDTSSDILPAIRRAQSTSSLASSGSRTGQRRALSVHFGELPPSRASRRESDSDSSSSGGSQKRRGPQEERLEAEGSEDVNSVMKKYLKKAEVD
ncbi:unconventional myosin-XVIIIb-like [Sinocyclocheilus rhinocerous]|uniref:unconventional myosin-XVIIIb-like n=1 Tax=Sinocyclocheilus rhinocerous TaxID=307959 RepID=UPI0007BAACCA|nr:PREDICTED: unconventional myosin-XVIIIb-like [Sinocyclocheilus rhinocerous]